MNHHRKRYRTKGIFLSALFEEKEVRVITRMIDDNIKRSSSRLSDAPKLSWGTVGAAATFCLRKENQQVLILEKPDRFCVELVSLKKASI